MLLTAAERQRFAEYLEREAHSSTQIAEQMKKMGGAAIGEVLAKQELLYAAAARLIAKRLRDTESMTVGGE